MVAAFMTDESKHMGIHLDVGNDETGGGVDQNDGQIAKLRQEVEALRRKVGELERGHMAWSNTLQHLLVVTLFHPRREVRALLLQPRRAVKNSGLIHGSSGAMQNPAAVRATGDP